MKNISLVWAGFYCQPVKGEYEDGNTAILLLDRDDSLVAVATVNIPDEELADGCVFVRNYSENSGILEVLENAGVLERTGRVVRVGYVKAHEAKVLI